MKVPSNKSLEPTRLTKARFVSVSSGAAQPKRQAAMRSLSVGRLHRKDENTS
jgi:hypothetical protein